MSQRGMPSAVFEYVTPELALAWLGLLHPQQRMVVKGVVSSYSNDMVAGLWFVTHQGIAFDSDGRLMDGQHRLWAIVESGKPQTLLVVRGIEHEAFNAIDRQRRRTVADALGRDPNVCAIAQAGWGWTKYGFKASMPPYIATKIIETFADSIIYAARFRSGNMGTNTGGIRTAPVAAAIARAHAFGVDIDRLDSFCRVLSGGIPSVMPDDVAALRCRQFVLGNNGRRSLRGYMWRVERAIKAHCSRSDLGVLREPSEDPFPLPVVPEVESWLDSNSGRKLNNFKKISINNGRATPSGAVVCDA